jgi:RNA polymerase sigma-70 factor (TIGR02960 family)
VVTGDLISRARAGDGDAFRELTEPYRRELQVYCYRMLGSLQDAEDALQDTLLAAWQGFGGFEGRASLRTWLYRIATNRCLNARRSASRRPAKEWDVPEVEPPEPTRLGEVVWLEPYPDALLAGAIDGPLGPEARYEQTEAISLAFVTVLQALPPRQLAVLLLRDVLGYHANKVADLLDSTVESVNSALKRARASLQRRLPPTAEREPPPAPDSPVEPALVAEFVRACESGDVADVDGADPGVAGSSEEPPFRDDRRAKAQQPLPEQVRTKERGGQAGSPDDLLDGGVIPEKPHRRGRIGSTTKTVTATALMRLVEQGKLDLEAPVRTYMPDFRVADAGVS